MGCIFTKKDKYHWTDWNYCMGCKHFHNPSTGKCDNKGSFILVDKQVEETIPDSYDVPAGKDEEGRTITDVTYDTVMEDGPDEPIYESTTTYDTISNPHTTYYTEPIYDYRFNGTSWQYVQTGTRNLSKTDEHKTYRANTKRTIVGYEKTKISKRVPVYNYRKVKTITTYRKRMVTKKDFEYIKDCKCTKHKKIFKTPKLKCFSKIKQNVQSCWKYLFAEKEGYNYM